jgi:hypothetical protein
MSAARHPELRSSQADWPGVVSNSKQRLADISGIAAHRAGKIGENHIKTASKIGILAALPTKAAFAAFCAIDYQQ